MALEPPIDLVLPESHGSPPKHCKVLVLGGGPSGAYAACVLAREGIDVTVFEASKFPRYHVGESLLPSVRQFLGFVGAEEKLMNHGFIVKPGSAIKFTQFKQEGYTDFLSLGHDNSSWNVVRSEFDELLLNHARECGAKVFEETRVKSLQFSTTDPTRPISASWERKSKSTSQFSLLSESTAIASSGSTSYDYLIDATGREGLMNTYLKHRQFNASLKNIAIWGYWSDTAVYGQGTSREGAPWFEALTDETGWAWFIPLHNGTTSVGIVMNQKAFNEQAQLGGLSRTLTERYCTFINLAPGVKKLIAKGTLTVKPVSPPSSPTTEATVENASNEQLVKSASDFSYSSPSYAGNFYRVAGDAGAFIDPFFSSGVHLAMTSALSAASTICASIRGDCTETLAGQWHTKRVATSYTRFQIVVLSAYKQITAQRSNVLTDVNEENYDRAFGFIRPLIWGAADMGKQLTESELQNALDFCVNLFSPTTPDQHKRVAQDRNIGSELLDVRKPVIDPKVFRSALNVQKTSLARKLAKVEEYPVIMKIELLTCQQLKLPLPCKFSTNRKRQKRGRKRSPSETVRHAETSMVLQKINARRVLHAEYAINNLETEPLDGLVVRLKRGNLGLAVSLGS